MKLENIVEIKAKLVLKTGLHIGAGDSEMHIGGIDNAVIKNPITQVPYIPGSSLKGKMRSLLEWYSGEIKDGSPLSIKDFVSPATENKEMVKYILQLFGISGDIDNFEVDEIGIGRLIFWDCSLSEEWEKQIRENGLFLTEAKTENSINRIKAKAENPRQTERVPAGAEFDFKLMLRQFKGDNQEALLGIVLKGLKLIEMDSLGGSGSRGYGKVCFDQLTVNGEDYKEVFKQIQPFGK
ncbi:type III-A CRISPR-associated RAMP protein Csm3 [Gallibacterium anatis]|uniref:type III-A CRISPR-associated RAMP protein Csm3 n=1 Tax=Gallibacterium anatis TaxID=750 RepID=UPI003006A558